MGVERNLPLIRERRQALLTGEADRIAEQKKLNKLTARERISALFDQGSFVELDTLVGGNMGAGVVTGYGLVDGRLVYTFAQDYTVLGGAVGAEQARKINKVQCLAAKTGAPLVAMFDSKGARCAEGIASVSAYAQIAQKTAQLSGVVPQIALVLGQCAASATAIAAMFDVVIASDAVRMYVNGPQVVSANKGEQVSAEDLGGAKAVAENGLANLTAKTDGEAIALARTVLSYLPDNSLDGGLIEDAHDDMNRETPVFESYGKVEDMHQVIAEIVDNGTFVEFSAEYAKDMIAGLAKLGGHSVGIIANRPDLDEGALTAAGCEKASRLVALCDCFNMPVISFVDTVGTEVACACGQGKLARACAKLAGTLYDAGVARIALVTGNAVSTGYMALASRAAADMVFAWPGSVISPFTAAQGVQVTMADRLAGAQDALAKRKELEEEYKNNVADGIEAAKLGLVDDVIEPAQTRQMLCAAVEMLSGKNETRLPKKHGNLPV
ncbi:MAG: acyl-CoA carboxylase subunit beta [Christensenellales bacterium]|jgi:acetyl-CoA carboxylase carboxyltransferase component